MSRAVVVIVVFTLASGCGCGSRNDAGSPTADGSLVAPPYDAGRTDAARPDAAPPSPCGECDSRYYTCCGTECVDLRNDPHNCGACGTECPPESPMCLTDGFEQGQCSALVCGTNPPTDCGDAGSCCGYVCCGLDEVCCVGFSRGPVPQTLWDCHPRDASTCPKIDPPPSPSMPPMCASTGTLVATPLGERAIEELREGDLVFSVEQGVLVAVPITHVSRTAAPEGHRMVRVTLVGGAVVEMSPGHPLPDGQTFADVARGAMLGEAEVESVEEVPYAGAFTYDILPASGTGAYFAAGALVGSTLSP